MRILDECQTCQRFSLAKNRHPLRPIGAQYPFEMISLDTGHVTLESGRREYFVLAIDHFTKWVEVQALTKETGTSLANFLRHAIIFRHGCPEKILTDNGPAYAGKIFKQECLKWGIRQFSAATYHPATNGLAERTIGTLKRSAERIANGAMSNWREHLGQAVMAYWMTPHVDTGFSPFRLMHGREATTTQEIGLKTPKEFDKYAEMVEEHTALVHQAFREAYKRSQRNRVKRAAKWNRRQGISNHTYKEGDLVWFDQRHLETHLRRGLQKWIGPLTVEEVTAGPNYTLSTSNPGGRERWKRVHPEYIKPFLGEPREGAIRDVKEGASDLGGGSVRDEDISAALAARAELSIRDPASSNRTRSDLTSRRDPSSEGTGEVIPGNSRVSPETKTPGEDATPRHDANRTSEQSAPFNGLGGRTSAGAETPRAMFDDLQSARCESDDSEPSKAIPDGSIGPGSAGDQRGSLRPS